MKKNNKRKKEVTIDELAMMIQKGFEETASKKELGSLEIVINQRFDKVDKRLDKIEFHTNTHERRIEILEDKMRMVSTKLGLR